MTVSTNFKMTASTNYVQIRTYGDDLKHEDNLKYEYDLKYEDNLQ